MQETYLVISPLPFKIFKVGQTVEATEELSKFIDFSDTKFFRKSTKPLYSKGQKIYVAKRSQIHYILEEPSLTAKGEWLYRIDESPKVSRFSQGYTVNEKDIKLPGQFWFINSNGVVCEEFENRPKIDKEGLEWKKLSGNFFTSKEDAQNHKIKIVSDNFNLK